MINYVLLSRRNTQARLKGSVLKTDRGVKARGGSNPSSSAILFKKAHKLEKSVTLNVMDFFYVKKDASPNIG